MCDDTHDCPLATGDAWLAGTVPLILASPAYRQQSSLVLITWDENGSGPTNRGWPPSSSPRASRRATAPTSTTTTTRC
jgi:acid phosphatase